MNYRQVGRTLCLILRCIALLMLLPALVGLLNHERETISFFITIAILLALSCGSFFLKTENHSIYAREGFAIVALSWILLGIFGAMPFVISGSIPNVFGAFFEIVSGFTTTGATVLTDVEALPRCMSFWRCFSIWIGGMGVLVFVLAIVPLSSGRDMHILRAESPGPSVGKLVPKMRHSAMILYGIYIALTLIEMLFLLAGGMSLFDAVTHAFSNAGTGGFSTRNAGIAAFDSIYIEVVLTVFMFLFSINFNLFYLILLKRAADAFKDEEFRIYLIILAISLTAITASIFPFYGTFATAFRYSSFQVASIVSTTGFSTADFSKWPALAQTVLWFLMFLGGCAGSTAGGLKCSRFLILVKSVRRELRRLSRPNSVSVVRLSGETLDEETVSGATMYFITYVCIFLCGLLLLSLTGLDFETTFSSVLTCISNVGPGFGSIVGPTGSFATLSWFSKFVLSILMLIGRLEIFPMLMLFSPALWRRRHLLPAGKSKHIPKVSRIQ